jgi:5-methylcytosine-specific restriction enzyme A
MHLIFTDETRARRACTLLARSICAAHDAGPSAWSVTLTQRMIRLNVGQVEVTTLRNGCLKLLVSAPAELPVSRGVELRYTRSPAYDSVPVPSGHAELDLSQSKPPGRLLEAHAAFIREAAGRKRHSPFARAFSEGVLRFLDTVLGGRLPRPDWFNEDDGLPWIGPDEVFTAGFVEGAVHKIFVNAYERDPVARARCIERHGLACAACEMTFGARYGDAVAHYIHVHHLRPLSEVRAEHGVDPIEDLRPICPNCHAVAHSSRPPLAIAKIRAMLAARRERPVPLGEARPKNR